MGAPRSRMGQAAALKVAEFRNLTHAASWNDRGQDRNNLRKLRARRIKREGGILHFGPFR
jgi:hypothetical protein